MQILLLPNSHVRTTVAYSPAPDSQSHPCPRCHSPSIQRSLTALTGKREVPAPKRLSPLATPRIPHNFLYYFSYVGVALDIFDPFCIFPFP